MNTTVVQKAVVVNAEGAILILRRSSSDKRRPLQWDLPGGMLEPGEGMIEGVEREVTEETGLQVSGTRIIFGKTEYRKWDSGEGSVVFLLYTAHATTTDIKLSFEHDQYEWKTIEQALPMFKYPLHIEYLTYLLEYKVAL